MYRNLNPMALGVSGRQSELIELALTYGFRSISINMEDFFKRAQKQGVERAARFLVSAQLRVGSFELPLQWRGEEGMFKAELNRLESLAPLAIAAGAKLCHVKIEPASDRLPYHENYELHRQRLDEIATVLQNHGMRLGIGILAAAHHREGREFEFLYQVDALLTLVKSIAAENVGVQLDSWNWHFGGGRFDQLRELGGRKITSVTLADAPLDVDAASVTEKQRLLPGDSNGGALDHNALMRLLQELDFSGPVTLLPHTGSFAGMTRDTIVQTCASVLDDLWREAGLSRSGKPLAATGPTATGPTATEPPAAVRT